jgi:hypothetical protein
MSVLLDLAQYSDEVEAFAGLADDFVDAASALRLNDVARELRNFVDAGTPSFTWQTRADIVFRPSNLYDGPQRQHTDTSLAIGFACEFSRPVSIPRRCRVWRVVQSATHLALSKDGGRLRFHIDYKNAGQWGPQIHFQIDEAPDIGNLSIPRIPSLSFLPTDCADLGLAELHPLEWRQVQASMAMNHHMSVVRTAQERRSVAYVNDIRRQWKDDTRATRICMLQDYTAKIDGLPDRHGNEARF